MTTLPQNTPARLSPPAGTAIVSPMAGGMAPNTMAPQSIAALTPGDIWRIFRANLWIIILLLLLSAPAGYLINHYWLDRYFREYTATGLLQVQPPMTNNPVLTNAPTMDMNTIAYEQKTQVRLLQQASLLSDVFANSGSEIKNTEWFQQFFGNVQKAKKELAEQLDISPVAETKLIAVSFSSSNAKDCASIVTDICKQHIANQRLETVNEQSNRSMVLNGLLDQYNRSLSSLQQGLRDRQIQFNIDEMGIPGRLSVKDIRMQSLVQEQLELSMKSQSIKAQLDTMSAQNAQGQVPAVITQEVEKDPIIQNMQIQLTYLTMSTPDDGSAMNPISRSTQSKITNLRQALETTRAQKLSEAMVAAVQGLQSEKAQYDQNLKTISDEVNKMKDEMGQLNNAMAVYLTDKDEEKLLLEQRKEVEDALNIIRTTSTAKDVAGVTWALMPQTPEIPSFPTLWKTMVASVAIALLLSAAIAFLREVSDTTVRSPRDIHRIGSMNFLGMIPHEDDDPQATGSRLPLVIFDAPNSMMADQLRQVRTRLQYAASLDTTRSILVTSPGPNDGKTMLACNLAAGLALNGRRILVVDADFRRPALHKIFQVDNKYGFCEALQDVEKFEDCLHETEVPNLFVMPCGTKPGNSTELLESQLLVDFIERALEEFDHVIFDSGSIMVVSEAIALAPRVDGVVTVVRARSNSRGLLQRMRDTLRQLKAEHLGIILNAVRAQGGGYYGRNIKTYYAYQNET